MLILSCLCEEEAANMSHVLRNTSEPIMASHPISITPLVLTKARAQYKAFIFISLCLFYQSCEWKKLQITGLSE